jgi:hypothetical protein
MRLRVSFARIQISSFLDLWIKSYGCLKILREIWVGRACAGTNEEDLSTCAQNWRQEE